MSKKSYRGLDAIELLVRGRRSKAKGTPSHSPKESLRRTARRTPEVMVKVTGGGKAVKQVYNHLTYITRNGALEGITDDGRLMSSREEMKELLEKWNLESITGYGRARLTHNLVLSMPKGTDAKRLHEAAKDFARNQFWDRHQYIMVLHTDQQHPHVHVCVKAESEDNKQLYVRKDTLETWRKKFAENLRDHGIAANATPREVRGVTRKSKSLKLYHAEKAGRSQVLIAKVKEIGKALQEGRGGKNKNPWDMALEKRRNIIVQAYEEAAEQARNAGDGKLADDLKAFAKSLPPIVTERDLIEAKLVEEIKKGRARTKGHGSRGQEQNFGHVQNSQDQNISTSNDERTRHSDRSKLDTDDRSK